MSSSIQQILNSNDIQAKKSLFLFDSTDSVEAILLKYNLFTRYFFPQYFQSPDAPFHKEINLGNIEAYTGKLDTFVDIAFRGAGKDVKSKLFIAFVIANDREHLRRYFKILSADITNSRQTTTDIYNMFVTPMMAEMYPEILAKTQYKREETMSSFTTSTGVKVISDTVGTDQRGAIQEESRPDFIWFNDFESRKTLRSAVITKAIHDNMEEARTSLQKGGACVYTCNYISEMGNVHQLVTTKAHDKKRVLIIPIIENGTPTWSRYTLEDIERMRQTDDDFEGERLCKPNASKDIYVDRESLERQIPKLPIKTVAGFKIFKNYDPSHRYAGGHDVAGGVGLDSSASVFIDFDTIPAQVVGTFHSNTIQPESFGDEIFNESNHFGGCLVAPENNKYDQALLKAKLLGADVYAMPTNVISTNGERVKTYGWNTNSLTKSKMFSSAKMAIESGLVELNDEDLIAEAKAVSRNDLLDKEEDARLSTRHFDLWTAFCIAWQMKDEAKTKLPRHQVLERQSEHFRAVKNRQDMNSSK